MRRLAVLLSLALVAVAASASSAQAAVAWAPCPDPGFGAFECARLAVPLDRAGAVPGTVELFARRLRAPEGGGRTALVALAGGPGQAAAPLAASFAVALAPGLRDRDLLVFDQRGTGQSAPLTCPALGRAGSTSAVTRCAEQLGPRRAFFRTTDSVADLEDLRRESGYEKLALYGASYGTKVAADYAERFPDRVDRLVLDSVVPQIGRDALQRSNFAAVPRILREQCAAGRCRSATPDPLADVRRLVRRRANTRGIYRDGRGRRRTGEISGGAVYPILLSSDLNPAWRAMVPGAVRAAARGDATPLLRLASLTLGEAGSPAGASWAAPAPGLQADEATNMALFLATTCEEVPLPWDRGAGPEQRARQATQALLAVPSSVYAPFDRATAAASGILPLCLGWPNATPPAAAPGALPGVPTLTLSGGADVRTPVADAQALAARIPSAPSVVVVPGVGHSVLSADPTGCARAAIAGFFNGTGVAPCPPARPLVRPLARPVRSVRELRPTARIGGLPGRTLTAVLRTRDDALVAGLGARLDGRTSVGGLRSGRITIRGEDVRLRGVEYVSGVRVSGTFAENAQSARLTVSGPRAARGTLTFRRDGRVSGRLGGRRIAIRPVTARAATATTSRSWTGFDRVRRLAALTRAAG